MGVVVFLTGWGVSGLLGLDEAFTAVEDVVGRDVRFVLLAFRLSVAFFCLLAGGCHHLGVWPKLVTVVYCSQTAAESV